MRATKIETSNIKPRGPNGKSMVDFGTVRRAQPEDLRLRDGSHGVSNSAM